MLVSRGTHRIGHVAPERGASLCRTVSLLVHVVYSTKDRACDLSPQLAVRLFPYMAGIVREQKSVPLIINGPADHVHLLVYVAATESISDLLRVVKTDSFRWLHEQFPEHKRFDWQAGYGVFTVSGSRAADVTDYIAAQQEHHRRVSFQEEFLTFLWKHGMRYARSLGLGAAFRPIPGLGIADTLFHTAHAVGYDLSPFGLGKCRN